MKNGLNRRKFIQMSGVGIGGVMLNVPIFGNNVSASQLLSPINIALKKKMSDIALNTATSKGASYVDVRIGRYLNQYIFTREEKVRNVTNTESFGAGVRVIVDGTWGFSATNDFTENGIKQAAEQAVAIAKANSKIQTEKVVLAPNVPHGTTSWKTPLKKKAMEVPISEKVELLLAANAAAMDNGASYINNSLFQVNEQKYFASSEGSYIDQDVHRIWPTFTVTCIDKESGKFKTRDALSSPMGMGYEYMDGNDSDKIAGPVEGLIFYNKSYDIVEDAKNAAIQAKQMTTADSVEPGKYSLVMEPHHLGLTIHESVGHPLELDRVLGYEANYAGTSFATIDKWKAGNFEYGSKIVNLVADKTQTHTLGAVGFDDEGVKCKKWDLVRDGVLVNYQAIRDQVKMLDQDESHGCCYADSWDSIQFQRMPNVSLEPGKEKYSVDDMISDVEKGIYVVGRGSYSIDQQRYNFQFGGITFFEILEGKITRMINDVAYQSNTQEFWNSCSKICDENDYRFFGSFFDGKGQPGQVSAVSHGSSTTRFDNINVINTARKI